MRLDLLDEVSFLVEAPRAPGSTHAKDVAEHLRKLLGLMGYSTWLHECPFTGWEVLGHPAVEFTRPRAMAAQNVLPVVWSRSTRGAVHGRVTAAGEARTFEAYKWTRYAIRDLRTGKLKSYLLTHEDTVWPQPLDHWRHPIPHLMVGPEDGQLIAEWVECGEEVRATASCETRFRPGLTVRNVGGNLGPTPSILLCAHYDSFYNTVGAHDNASGVAAALELARRVAARSNQALRVVFFDAEEWNKFGSYSYVRTVDLRDLKGVINIDSVGAGDGLYALCSPCLDGAVREAAASVDGTAIQVGSRAEFGQFDTWPFMQLGIPVIQVGSTGQRPYPHFHSPADTMSHISKEQIEAAVELAGALLGVFECGRRD